MLTPWRTYYRTPSDPFTMLDAIREEMDRVFANHGLDSDRGGSRLRNHTVSWPRIDLFDAGNELVVRADMPGLSEDEIELVLQENTLTLKGQRKEDQPEGYTPHRSERGAFSFARSFTLPSKVDAEKARAEMKNGVLSIHIAKAAEVQPRQITVQAK